MVYQEKQTFFAKIINIFLYLGEADKIIKNHGPKPEPWMVKLNSCQM